MTKKEAVEVLKTTMVNFGRNQGKTAYIEALELAINELESSISENTVNMSLAHYDRMKDCIRVQKQHNKILNSDNERLMKMFISIGIPRDCIPAIVPNSFSLSECKDISGRFDRIRRIKIAFDVDSEKLREVGR